MLTEKKRLLDCYEHGGPGCMKMLKGLKSEEWVKLAKESKKQKRKN